MSVAADAAASRAIRRATIAAAGISVVLSPIPLADELTLLPVYAWLTVRVAHARGRSVRQVPWKPLAKTAFVGLVARGAVDATMATVPGVAAVINATTAVALTQIYGACVDHVCTSPGAAISFGPSDVVDAIRARSARRSVARERRRSGQAAA